MKKVGLTGNLGCGKSTVGKMFAELGATVFDADRIIRSFYIKETDVYRKVVEEFGDGILDGEGNIDRKKLAGVVFEDREKLTRLEGITHRALYDYLEKRFSELPEDSVVVVEAALIFEKGSQGYYDYTVVVWAPYVVCLERAIKKGMSREDFERRWGFQMDIDKKAMLADFVIDNSDGLERTAAQVREVYRKIKEDP
jgi:dephospho-CoA kinase